MLFTFPSRYWCTIGGNAYLALGGPPRFPQASSWLVVLGYQQQHKKSVVRGSHPLWRAVPGNFQYPFCIHFASTAKIIAARRKDKSLRRLPRWLSSLVDPTTPKRMHFGLGSSPVARRYWGNHVCFLFLRVLRCFSSPRYLSLRSDGSLHPPGCPIRKPVDQGLLAAPYGISSLGTSFVGALPQGIHQRPCVALNTVTSHAHRPPTRAWSPNPVRKAVRDERSTLSFHIKVQLQHAHKMFITHAFRLTLL